MGRWLRGLLMLLCGLLAVPACAIDAAELERLALLAAARPADGLRAWQDLAARTPPSDPTRWQALLGAGMSAAALGMPQTLEAVTTELAASQPEAAKCLQADHARQHGSVREAAAQLDAIALPEATPLLVRAYCELVAGLAQEARGGFDESLRHYQDALQAADALGSTWLRATVRSAMTASLVRSGQVDSARRMSDEALTLARAEQQWVIVGNVLVDRLALLPRGPADAAERRALIQEALDAWGRVDAERRMVGGLVALADAALQAKDLPAARTAAADALARAVGLHMMPSVVDTARLKLGVALVGLNHMDEGMGQISEAVASQRHLESIVRVADFLLEAGGALESAGHLADAYRMYADYRAVWTQVARQLRQQALADLQERQDAEARRAEQQRLDAERVLRDERLAQQRLRVQITSVAGALSLLLALSVGLALRRMRARARLLAQARDLAQRDARQDALTGLASREEATIWLRSELDARPGTVMLVDIDHFKQVNDQLGHAVGDAVLIEVARRLQGVVREADLVARWGGEEFLVAIGALDEDGASAADAQLAWARRVLEAVIAEPLALPAGLRAVTVSIGVAPLRRGADPAWDAALARADAALYGAKLLGRCGIVSVLDMGRAPSHPPANAEVARGWCAQGVWWHEAGTRVADAPLLAQPEGAL